MLSGLKRKVGRPELLLDVEQTVATLQSRTSELADAIRNLSHQLHPSVLQHAGLIATLQRHCVDIEQHHRLKVSFTAARRTRSLNPDVALCLFRVAQEALTNATRHARARTILVQLAAIDGGVELRIVDDGVGFVAGERDAHRVGSPEHRRTRTARRRHCATGIAAWTRHESARARPARRPVQVDGVLTQPDDAKVAIMADRPWRTARFRTTGGARPSSLVT